MILHRQINCNLQIILLIHSLDSLYFLISEVIASQDPLIQGLTD